MKILLKIIKFLYFFTIFLYSPVQARLLDVQISLDASEMSGDSPITAAVGLALCQKSSPIITTSHIVYNILKARQNKDPKYSTIPIDQNWDIYKLKYSEDFFLFIPKEYKQNVINKYDTPAFRDVVAKLGARDSIEEILLGFKIDPGSNIFQQVTLAEYDTNAKIQAIKHSYYDVDPHPIYKMFVQGKEDIYALWNIVIDGHGFYTRYIEPNVTMNDLVETNIGRDASLAGLSLSDFRRLIQFFINKIKVNFLYYSTCYGGDVNLILPYITALVHSSGRQRLIGGLEKPNFTIAVGSLTSEPVTVSMKKALTKCNVIANKKNIPQGLINYKLYFDLLHKYNNPNSFSPTLFNDKELREILNAITPRVTSGIFDPHGISGLPSVMFPKTDTFRAVALDDTISIISNVLVKKHELEKKPITIKDKEVILIYPQNISVPLRIKIAQGKPIPSIVSMVPGLSLIKFDEINININFNELVNALGSTRPVFNKYFYIKKLKIINPASWANPIGRLKRYAEGSIELSDVFISLSVLMNTENIKIIYTGPDLKINSYNYWSIKPIQQLILGDKYKTTSDDDFINALYNYFYLIPDKEQVRKDFNFDSFKKLLSKEEIKTLESTKPISKLILPPPSPDIFDQRKFNQTINKINLFINISSKINNIKNVNRKKQLTRRLRNIRRNIINQFDLNIKNAKGQTPLMVRPNLIPFLKELPKNKARQIVNAKDNDNKTILNHLIDSKNNLNVQAYKALINVGAKPTRQDIALFRQKVKARGPKFKKILRVLRGN